MTESTTTSSHLFQIASAFFGLSGIPGLPSC
jgi:hypothetical protein